MMTDKQVFGLVIRVLGVFLVIYGLMDVCTGLAHWLSPPKAPAFSTAAYILAGLITIVAGVLLTKGKWLVRFAYGPES